MANRLKYLSHHPCFLSAWAGSCIWGGTWTGPVPWEEGPPSGSLPCCAVTPASTFLLKALKNNSLFSRKVFKVQQTTYPLLSCQYIAELCLKKHFDIVRFYYVSYSCKNLKTWRTYFYCIIHFRRWSRAIGKCCFSDPKTLPSSYLIEIVSDYLRVVKVEGILDLDHKDSFFLQESEVWKTILVTRQLLGKEFLKDILSANQIGIIFNISLKADPTIFPLHRGKLR